MKYGLVVLLLVAMPAAAADNAAERAAKSVGGQLDKAAKGIERGAKATGKAAERPRRATQKFLEKSGDRINKATGSKQAR